MGREVQGRRKVLAMREDGHGATAGNPKGAWRFAWQTAPPARIADPPIPMHEPTIFACPSIMNIRRCMVIHFLSRELDCPACIPARPAKFRPCRLFTGKLATRLLGGGGGRPSHSPSAFRSVSTESIETSSMTWAGGFARWAVRRRSGKTYYKTCFSSFIAGFPSSMDRTSLDGFFRSRAVASATFDDFVGFAYFWVTHRSKTRLRAHWLDPMRCWATSRPRKSLPGSCQSCRNISAWPSCYSKSRATAAKKSRAFSAFPSIRSGREYTRPEPSLPQGRNADPAAARSSLVEPYTT